MPTPHQVAASVSAYSPTLGAFARRRSRWHVDPDPAGVGPARFRASFAMKCPANAEATEAAAPKRRPGPLQR